MRNVEKILTQAVYRFLQSYGRFFLTFLFLFISMLFFEFLLDNYFFISFSLDKIAYSFLYALLFSGIIFLFGTERIRQWLIFICITVLSLLYLIEAVHFRAFRSIALLDAVSRITTLAGVTDSIFEFVSPDLLYFSLPIVLFSLFLINPLKMHVFGVRKIDLKKTMFLFIIVALLFTGMNYHKIQVRGDSNKQRFRNSTMYLKKYGLIDTLFKELTINMFDGANSYEETPDEIIDEHFKYLSDYNNKTNKYKGKNLVFIEAESIGTYAIDEKLTPTLYKLKQEGLNFTNYYSARINTFDSEYAILNSFYLTPEKQREAFTPEGTMPTLFRNEGYRATSYHDYKSASYARNMLHPELGFEQFYSAPDLELDDTTAPDFPNDAEFFKNTFPLYSQDSKPFFAYHVTVSAHAGYTEHARPSLAENLSIVRETYPQYDAEVQVYLAAAMQTDQGVAQLLNDLETSKLLEDTVIVFVGDHYPYALKSAPIKKHFNVASNLELYKVPFIIWDASKPSETVPYLSTNVDILPTIANLFNLDLHYSMGQDLFSTRRDEVMIDWHDTRSYSFLTTSGGYDGELDAAYGGTLSEEEKKELQQLTYNREDWNNSDYVRHRMKR